MSNIKNKDVIYAVMRKDIDKRDFPAVPTETVCCFAKTLLGAEELCGEYQQEWEDSGGQDNTYYYVVGNIFYDK